MIVYHGSYTGVDKPDLCHSRLYADFGKGFYTTLSQDQAVRWCDKFRRMGKKAIVSHYAFDERDLQALNVLSFDFYSDEWLDFILSCRNGLDSTDYDLVIGGTVSDKVFNTLELYCNGLIGKGEAISRLSHDKPDIQMAFRTVKALSYLRYEGSHTI